MTERNLKDKKERSELVKKFLVGGIGLTLEAGLTYAGIKTGYNEGLRVIQVVVGGLTLGYLISSPKGNLFSDY